MAKTINTIILIILLIIVGFFIWLLIWGNTGFIFVSDNATSLKLVDSDNEDFGDSEPNLRNMVSTKLEEDICLLSATCGGDDDQFGGDDDEECQTNSDCGENYYDDEYCWFDDVYENYIYFNCDNEKCEEHTRKEKVEDCLFGCEDGSCIEEPECEDDDDCGENQICKNNQCVDVECYDNSDCDDSDNYTTDVCILPGTTASYCENTPINCNSDNDCGTDGLFGDLFCETNSISQNYIDWTCQNPGTESSQCAFTIESTSLEDCEEGEVCNNGGCLEVECYDNSDCNDSNALTLDSCENPGTIESYCINDEIVCNNDTDCDDSDDFTVDGCENPGTIESYCSHDNITCFHDIDCGTNGFVGYEFCQINDVFQDFLEWNCENPGSVDSSCTFNTEGLLTEECSSTCENGSCVECVVDDDCSDSWYSGNYCGGSGDVFHNHNFYTCESNTCVQDYDSVLVEECSDICVFDECVDVECSSDSDCGLDGFEGALFCETNNIFQNFKDWTCENPGTVFSSCIDTTTPTLLEDCESGETCINGECVEDAECYEDSDCQDSWYSANYCSGSGDVFHNYNFYTCESNTCVQDYDSVLVDECSDICVFDECVEVECFDNSECGTDGLVGDEFCTSDDVWQDYRTYTCSNAGTGDSSCNYNDTPQLKETCEAGNVCESGECAPAGQWVFGWYQSCNTTCTNVGLNSTYDYNGHSCTSGENVVEDAVNQLGTWIYQAGCWNNPCTWYESSSKTLTSEGKYCWEPGQKHDYDCTDRIAACYCE